MSLWRFALLVFSFNLLIFGNGPGMIPMLQAELVESAGVLSTEQLLYAFAVARLTPGQANVYVASIGYFLFGLAGAALATLAIQLPGYLILPYLRVYERLQSRPWVRGFNRGLTTASVGLIFAATLSIGASTLTSPAAVAAFLAAFALAVLRRWNQMVTLLAAGALGIGLESLL
jgi:chromate transporter